MAARNGLNRRGRSVQRGPPAQSLEPAKVGLRPETRQGLCPIGPHFAARWLRGPPPGPISASGLK
jgi:hypothetical protein